jgi:hypothetical protein
MRVYVKLLAFTGLIALGCGNDEVLKGTPKCVEKLIRRIKNQPVSNPPSKVFRYSYKGKTVYYIPPKCCDIPSKLVDENCNVICSPDGGFTGIGDGRCTDFFAYRSKEELIWQDSRR